MEEYIDRYGAERVWLAVVGVLIAVVVLAAVMFPQRVYVDIIWQYYWGPVVADANGWSCVAWADGQQVDAGFNCGDAGPDDGPTATPGYTFISYAGYIPILLLLLVGIVFAIQWLDVDRYRAGFFGLFPWMLFGGALRVVEDANVATGAEGEMLLSLPWSALLISPFIYVVVALLTLVALIAAVWLERRGSIRGYEYGLAGFGTLALVAAVAVIAYLWTRADAIGFFPSIAIVTLVGATAITGAVWWITERVAPQINEGTGYMGLVVVWAHSIDGIANLIGLSYAQAFGWPYNLSPKHPINAAIVDFFGNAWPFLALKIAAAIFIIWIFNDEFFEESPRFAIVLMITVVAVGLGPGTRDMLRATFGI